jgi:hypothetical protein
LRATRAARFFKESVLITQPFMGSIKQPEQAKADMEIADRPPEASRLC